MPTDRKLHKAISTWLEAEAPTRMPDRVLRATFERTRKTRQQGRWRALQGRLAMNRSVLALGGAAVVVVAAVVALNAFGRPPSGVGGQTTPAPSPVTTPKASAAVPSAVPTTRPAGLAEGPHLLISTPDGVKMTVTIAAPGWAGDGGILVKNDNADPPDGAGMIVFAGEDLYVYGNPCQWSTTRPDKPSTTVDTFVAAMAAQALRDASEPVDVSLGGYTGKAITVHVPDDANFGACDQGYFGSFGVVLAVEPTPARYHQGPGQIDNLWVFDVDGELVVIDWAYYAGTPQAVIDEMKALVESTTFE